MPWTPLTDNAKRAADKLRKTKAQTRPLCWTHKRKTLAAAHGLGFWGRLKFWHRSSK